MICFLRYPGIGLFWWQLLPSWIFRKRINLCYDLYRVNVLSSHSYISIPINRVCVPVLYTCIRARVKLLNWAPCFVKNLKFKLLHKQIHIRGVVLLTLEGGSKPFSWFSWWRIFRFAEERVGYRRGTVVEVIGVSSSIRGLPLCFVHDLVTTGIFRQFKLPDYKYINDNSFLESFFRNQTLRTWQ